MKINDPDLKKFIEKYINYIENDDFGFLYEYATKQDHLEAYHISAFTEIMYDAEIDPLKYLQYIPSNFLYESDIEKFEIPEHVDTIQYSAFDSCDKLKHIKLHENIKFVDEYAFYSCDQLTSMDIQNPNCEIKAIGFPAFIPVVRYNGNLDQWRDFITKNSLEFLECNRLELTDREIFQYKIEKIN